MKTYYWEFGVLYLTAVNDPQARWQWVKKAQGDYWTVWAWGRWNFGIGCIGARQGGQHVPV